MDFDSIHGPGISKFSSPRNVHALDLSALNWQLLSDRLPTVSAAQALQDLTSSPTRYVSTRVDLLDKILQNRPSSPVGGDSITGGVSRGKVTEIYGPSGIGKTTLGFVLLRNSWLDLTDMYRIHLAVSALLSNEGVLWVGQYSQSSLIGVLGVLQEFKPWLYTTSHKFSFLEQITLYPHTCCNNYIW